ncbi:cyclin-dependent kinase 4 inhibitor B-like isoform X2 [Amphiura filiformis]|uniref:cyclin-dependent kinase 4 inhibitor B-like isoform X2 n=1 Tax=Amphiura filiformis TaxID=82378 RepID=UPI003B21F36C
MDEQEIHENAQPNPSSDDKELTLTEAAAKGKVERVRILLNQGVDPNSTDQNGRTALQTMNWSYPEIAMMLLEKGANPNPNPEVQDPDVGRTPLHDAVAYGTPDTVKCLLIAGADVTKTDINGKTPYDLAVGRGNAEIIASFTDH